MLKRTFQIIVMSVCFLSLLSCLACSSLEAIAGESKQRLADAEQSTVEYKQKSVELKKRDAELKQKETELEQEEAALEQELAEANTITELATITEFDTSYEGSVFSITATNIRAIQSRYNEHDEIVIGVRLVVENISDNENDFGAVYINAYVDDVAAAWATSSYLEENLSLRQTIVPGKRAEGYYCVNAPKDAKTIELYVPADDPLKKNYVVFNFDIPPIEELDS